MMSCLIECSLQNSSLHWKRNVFAQESGRFSDWAANKMTTGLIWKKNEQYVKKWLMLKLRMPPICHLPAKVWVGVRSNSPIALCSCVHSPDISSTVPAARITSNLRFSFSLSEFKSELAPGSLIFSMMEFMLSNGWGVLPWIDSGGCLWENRLPFGRVCSNLKHRNICVQRIRCSCRCSKNRKFSSVSVFNESSTVTVYCTLCSIPVTYSIW